MAQISRMAGSV